MSAAWRYCSTGLRSLKPAHNIRPYTLSSRENLRCLGGEVVGCWLEGAVWGRLCSL